MLGVGRPGGACLRTAEGSGPTDLAADPDHAPWTATPWQPAKRPFGKGASAVYL